jgi:hypothetical protein
MRKFFEPSKFVRFYYSYAVAGIGYSLVEKGALVPVGNGL